MPDLTPEQYWKLMALVQRCDHAIQRAVAIKAQVLREQGLDPEKDYTFDDAAMTVTEVPRG